LQEFDEGRFGEMLLRSSSFLKRSKGERKVPFIEFHPLIKIKRGLGDI